MLDATSQLAELQWESEKAKERLHELARGVAQVKKDNREIMRASEEAMKNVATASEAVRSLTAKRDNAKLRQDTRDRLQEDYEIDLRGDERPEDWEPPEDRRAWIESEITQLRNQLQKTSSVNMEAARGT